MADLRATWQILTYNPDRGPDPAPIAVKGNLVVPVGFGATATETLLNAMGAQLIKFGGTVINNVPSPPCPDSGIFSPRKLIFYLANGVSVGFPLAARTNAVSAAAAGIISLGTVATVVCIKLQGEKWGNLMDILGQSGKTPTVSGLDPRGKTYSRQYDYQTDASNPLGGVVKKKFKVDSELDDAPPAVIGNTAWITSVGVAGSPGANFSCGGRDRRKHRRYIATCLVDRGGLTRATQIEIPVSSSTSGDIRTAGDVISALPPVACLQYIGESYDRFHQIQ
jgi:hypothetical protein